MKNLDHIFNEIFEINKDYNVVKCESCGFHHVHPYPKDDFLDNFYSMEYKDELKKINLSEKVKRICNMTEGKNILDVGCGEGDLLTEFKKEGFNVYGLEPSIESVKECEKKGLNVKQGMLGSNMFNKKFDFVNLSFVLEHIPNPSDVLNVIKRDFLKEGGYIIIEVPNDFSFLQQCYSEYNKESPYWIHFPDHLNYWNFNTFIPFIEKLGFEIVYKTSSFPLEIFLLMGEDYIKNKELGKKAHYKRVEFEKRLKEIGYGEKIFKIYEKLSELNIGREIHLVAKSL
ncbi:methyltransferase domain-containing protein [Dethiothermospora halolimnae]|uniref:class I SAM-dependent methyltransferase n=1 Tax=Dethiothermospora halolimnae TaxID=3114390 RepID=UPI003CCBEAAF